MSANKSGGQCASRRAVPCRALCRAPARARAALNRAHTFLYLDLMYAALRPASGNAVCRAATHSCLRIAPDLNLGGAALWSSDLEEVAPARLGNRPRLLPKWAPEAAAVRLIAGSDNREASDAPDAPAEATAAAPGDPAATAIAGEATAAASGGDAPGLDAQYRAVTTAQLPGVPPYDDCTRLVLTLDAERCVVAGGATFRLLKLTTSSGVVVLVLDVLGLAVSDDAQGCGAGSLLVGCLKALLRREAAAACARAVLLTQADDACLPFWEKQGFAIAIDACALVRTLRSWREDDCVIFTGATPMALALPPPARRSKLK